jgi:putative DNA primase/helicase
MLRVQKKFGQAHSTIPYCKQIYSCNQLPKLKSSEEAFYQRWIILHFDHQFTPDDPKTDPYLLEKLSTSEELSGLLNWALEGLARLEASNGRFSYAPKAQDTQEEWDANADPIEAFCDALEVTETRNTEDKVSSERLYQLYVQFCEGQGIKAMNDAWFGKSLRNHLHNITKGSSTDEYGKRAKYYRGLKIG